MKVKLPERLIIAPLVMKSRPYCREFTGLIKQVPPVFSAVKVKGRRAYALARERTNSSDKLTDIALKPREVMINKFEITAHFGQQSTFTVQCGKGTYIRALARDIGRALGSAAHVVFLERCAVGRFKIEDAIDLDFFDQMVYHSRARMIISFLL